MPKVQHLKPTKARSWRRNRSPAMKVARRRTPPDSAFLGDLRSFYYWDSYEAPLAHGDLAMHELYLALFAHHPRWARWLLILRGWIVRAVRAARHDDGGLRGNRNQAGLCRRRQDRPLHLVRAERPRDRHRRRRQASRFPGVGAEADRARREPGRAVDGGEAAQSLRPGLPARHPAVSPARRQDDPVERCRGGTGVSLRRGASTATPRRQSPPRRPA